MLEMYNDVISVEELCKILNIGKNSAYKLLKTNVIPNKRLTGKYIIPKIGVVNFLEKCIANGPR